MIHDVFTTVLDVPSNEEFWWSNICVNVGYRRSGRDKRCAQAIAQHGKRVPPQQLYFVGNVQVLGYIGPVEINMILM
jgi:hypothetical protein